MTRQLVTGSFLETDDEGKLVIGQDGKPVRRQYAYMMVTGPEAREIADRILGDPSRRWKEQVKVYDSPTE